MKNTEELISRWKPIIETLNVEERHVEKLATYAQQHSMLEIERLHNVSFTETTLPYALKVLSKIENLDKVIIIDTKQMNYCHAVIFKREELEMPNFKDYCENIMVSSIANVINDVLKSTENINIYMLFNFDIKFDDEETSKLLTFHNYSTT
jgi:hypothetical protein